MFKKLLEWLKRPRGWTLILFYVFTVICIAGSIVASIIWHDTSYGFVAYVFYVLAAVTLGYAVYTIVIYAPTVKRKITDKLKANKFTANVLGDYEFKTAVFAIISFAITIAFVFMNLAGAILYRLTWYGAIAAYYFVLVLFRGSVLLANKKCSQKFSDDADKYEECKWKIYLSNGAFLILLEFAMAGAVTQMMLSERPTQSGMIMAISNATYAFYKITMAIINLVKARKLSNPVTQSLRNLNFADACMSIVSLTVLMISTFDSAEASEAMQYVKYVVGFVICAVIIAVATVMIIRASKKLQSFKENIQ